MPTYFEPYVICRNFKASPRCERIVLPFRGLPNKNPFDLICSPFLAETGEYPVRWPEDGWQAAIGCPYCEAAFRYGLWDVRWEAIDRDAPGVFHSDTKCYRVEFECARPNCRLPVQVHTVLGGVIPTENALRDMLHDGLFHEICPAGHDLLPIPRDRYRLTREVEAIPSGVKGIYLQEPVVTRRTP